MIPEIHETDILIIGGGIAGVAAAIDAGQTGINVLVVAKGPMTKTGITPLGFTGYTAVTGFDPEDSPELQFRDTVESGRYLPDQNLVEAMTTDGEESFRNLLRYGVNFQKLENGSFLLRHLPGMSRPRCLRIPAGGQHLIEVLAKQVPRYPNVRVIADLAVYELLKNDRRVVGCLALDLKSGKPLVVHAKATILATGGKEQLWPYSDCPPESTGDGLVLAYHAGADLIDLEQELFYPTVVIYPEHVRGLEISYESFLKPGAKILNGKGDNIAPVGNIIPTRDQLANHIYKEIKDGWNCEHNGVLIDLREAPAALKESVRISLPAYKRLKYFGIEITEQTLEVAPAAHTSLGGVHIDENGRTCVEGLFACGETAGNVHGANRLAGQAWLDCMVFGSRAGKFAASFAKSSDFVPLNLDHLQIAEEELRTLIGQRNGRYRPHQVIQQIKNLMWEFIGLRRKAESMRKGLVKIEEICEGVLPYLAVDQIPGYSLERIQALQVRSLVELAEMVTRAALCREESRGTHFREDFPDRDDVNWLAHTVVHKDGNEMEVTKRPVVITRFHPK